MSEKPLVSIITPSFNQGAYLEQTLESVLRQTYAPIEYMVMDGASGDQSRQIIRRFAHRLAHWESLPDRGQAHAINKGLALAKGEILGWLNADDILLPESVARVVDMFEHNPQIDVVYGRLERIDERGNVVPTPILPKDRITFDRQVIVGECVVNQPGSFWRRRVMDAAGLLDENLVYTLDYDYWIRMALAGARFLRLSEPVAQFRLSAASKTVSQSAGMAEEQLLVLDKVLRIDDLPGRTGLSPKELARLARKTRSRISLHAFLGYYKKGDHKSARKHLAHALQQDPLSIFDPRWVSLAYASLRRRLARLRV